jgi:type IV pilus assembly protein PilO
MAMDFGGEKVQELLERFAKLPKAYRFGAIPVIAALVFGAYWYLLYEPASRQLEALRAKQLESQRKLNEARSVTANLPAFQEEIEKLERELKLALRQLPNSKELPILLTDISTVGKNAGLDFKAFRPQEEVPKGFYAEVPIEIEFTGRFRDIAKFFDEVARLPRIVNVGDLHIQIHDESGLETWLKVKGEATTFRFIEPQATPAHTPGQAQAPSGANKGGTA